jgi:hypothetical protein
MAAQGHFGHGGQRDRRLARADWRKDHCPIMGEEEIGGFVLVWSQIHLSTSSLDHRQA